MCVSMLVPECAKTIVVLVPECAKTIVGTLQDVPKIVPLGYLFVGFNFKVAKLSEWYG
jgi:hypothetical protein